MLPTKSTYHLPSAHLTVQAGWPGAEESTEAVMPSARARWRDDRGLGGQYPEAAPLATAAAADRAAAGEASALAPKSPK